MNKQSRRSIKTAVNIFTFVALAVLIYISRHAIADAFGNLGQLNSAALFLMLPLQAFGYYCIARLYKDFFKSRGEHLSLRKMYEVALELNFVNHVFPSGGVSGFSYLSLRLKKEGISTAQSTLAQIMRFALTFVSFLILLVFGVFVLALRRHTSPITILISTSIVLMTVFGVLVGVYIISSERRIKSFTRWLPKALNAIIGKFRRSKADTINIARVESTMEDLHRDYEALSRDWRQLKKPFIWALLLNITEVATIYSAYVAFGSFINPGGLILAYAVANFAGLVAVLPGGVGIYEGLMTAVMTATGVDKALALSATVVYRVITMVIGLPIGYYFYHKNLNSEQKETFEQTQEDLIQDQQ
ncbi:MAG: flippase-like domain-containing protein [bacterium]|nr:flippase-like domain-containing protein [bacterium]